MSEYQYYEFAAVDQPLTAQQQAELRDRSSRATISSGSFINEYHWGSLKGDPVDWMERYFDAHVYSANWGRCRLMLRLPRAALEAEELAPFTAPATADAEFGPLFSVVETAEHWILDWDFNDDSGEIERFWPQDDGPGWMGRLLPLRDELLRGDTRPLYLGWLARANRGEFEDGDLEPPLPAGLGSLSAAQQALAEFLLIDPDWLDAAAADSPAIAAAGPEDADVELWLQERSEADLRATVRLLLESRGLEAERSVRRAYLAWQKSRCVTTVVPELRSLGRIVQKAMGVRARRLEAERLAREAKAAKAQAEYAALLDRLVQEAPQVWQEIDSTVERGTGGAYEKAFQLLQTLAEAFRRADREADFRRGLVHLLERHGRRPAWIKRLEKAGFM
jgi:hypothetical protein